MTVDWFCPEGCLEGSNWIPYEKGGIEYAKPCPVHRPEWVHPSRRTKEDNQESLRQRNIERAKKRYDL